MKNKIDEIRTKKGLTVAEVARKAKTSIGQINKLKSGERRLTTQWLERLSVALDCSIEELITTRKTIPIVGYIGAGAEIYPIDDHAQGAGMEEVDAPLDVNPDNIVAVRVKGDSMQPVISENWVLFYTKKQDGVPDYCLNKLCVVKTQDDKMFVKTLKKGYEKGKFNLISHNGADMENIALEWAARVKYIKPT